MDKQNKKDHSTDEVKDGMIILHCETVVFLGNSFIKREDLGKKEEHHENHNNGITCRN